ncbi:MAG: ribbon-helix-helix protein, CopG family [Gemmatimonadales bacterium]
MDDQITLRLPRGLARALARRARQLGVPKSRVVREALEAYLAGGTPEGGLPAWGRVQALIGAVELDPGKVEQDALARRIREHNWR